MALLKKKPQKSLPTTLGELIDAAYDAREALQSRQKELDSDPLLTVLKDRFEQLEAAVLAKFAEERSTLARGTTARAFTGTEQRASTDPETGGWPATWKFVEKYGAWDILYKRLNNKAVADRITESKKAIPGVKLEAVTKLHLRSINEKD